MEIELAKGGGKQYNRSRMILHGVSENGMKRKSPVYNEFILEGFDWTEA